MVSLLRSYRLQHEMGGSRHVGGTTIESRNDSVGTVNFVQIDENNLLWQCLNTFRLSSTPQSFIEASKKEIIPNGCFYCNSRRKMDSVKTTQAVIRDDLVNRFIESVVNFHNDKA